MAQDDGAGEEAVQVCEQVTEALSLGRGTGVGGESEEVEAALVADAYGVAVVAPAVGAFLPQGTPLVDLPVPGDVVVVADVLVASGEVVLSALAEGVALPGLRGRAVQDNHGNSSHGFTQKAINSHRKHGNHRDALRASQLCIVNCALCIVHCSFSHARLRGEGREQGGEYSDDDVADAANKLFLHNLLTFNLSF